MDVAEDVEAGADAPDLAEEVGAAEAEIEVVLLFCWEEAKSYMTRSQPGGLGHGWMGGRNEEGGGMERGWGLTGGVWVTRMSV